MHKCDANVRKSLFNIKGAGGVFSFETVIQSWTVSINLCFLSQHLGEDSCQVFTRM